MKHSGVRAALHEHLVKTGRLDPALGEFYDDIFRARQEADYGEVEVADADSVAAAIGEAERFVTEIERLRSAA